MKKELLASFIRRYSLGGIISKVKWKYIPAEKTLHTRALADNRSFIADVIWSDFSDFGDTDAAICIGDTARVVSLMAPFGDDITLKLNLQGDRLLGFTMSDTDCESYCTAANPTTIDPVPKNLQDIPDYDVVVPLTDEFLEKFLKARSALKDVKTLSVGMNKDGLFEMVMGYTTANSNRIRLTPPTDANKKSISTALAFPLDNIAEVLKANKDIPSGTLSINGGGITRIHFKDEHFSCTYYQFANKKT
jgi:hypothetical protein